MGSKFYAVTKGKNPGIYTSWDDCYEQVHNFKDARFKSFKSKEEAEEFLKNSNMDYSEKKESDITTYAFVDGSFNSKLNIYGYGGFLIHKIFYEKDGVTHTENSKAIIQGSGSDPEMVLMRNVAGEILGAMAAIELAIYNGYEEITLFYDYAGIEMWATGQWNRTKESTKKYYDFIQEEKKKIKIYFVKVKGHIGVEGNEEVDKLAKQACGIL